MRQFLPLVLFLSALPLAAQTVVSVQSGEHDGFSRLVLRVDPALNWVIEENRGEAALVFPNQELRFSIDRVFDRISTERIASLASVQEESSSRLVLGLNCKCELQAFAFKDNYLVVDIFDGDALDPSVVADNVEPWRPDALPYIQPPASISQFNGAVMAESPRQPNLMPDPPPVPEEIEPVAPEMAELATPSSPDIVAEITEMAGGVVSGMNEVVEVQEDPEMRARIEEAQTQLLAQLTRAADQGLVDFAPKPVTVAEVVEETRVEIEEVVPSETQVDPILLAQLSARTAYEQGTEDSLAEVVNQFAMPQCLDDVDFSMSGWGGETGFSEQLAQLRSSLLGEFDVADTGVSEQLVQLYLRYGLGAEARLILTDLEDELSKYSIYKDMADIIEGEPSKVLGPVLQGAGCGGNHEMWFLAAGFGTYQVMEPLLIADVFSEYPIEVRTIIGPPLAEAFIRRDQVDAGFVVLEIVRRADGEVTVAQRLAEARVLEAQHDTVGAEAIFRALAQTNDELAPEALIAYARSLLGSGQAVPVPLLVDLEAAAFFNRETDRGDSLRLLEIRVRTEVESENNALAQISENLIERPYLSSELRRLVAEIFEVSAAGAMGDYQYAQMVLQYSGLLDQGEAGDLARLKIAREMAEIGLPETALDVLAPNLLRSDMPTKHFEASAYVQLFEPTKALEVLAGDESFEAYKIRLDAQLQLQDFTAVAQMLGEEYAHDVSLDDIALRAGDWEKIQAAGSVGILAAFMKGEAVAGPIETPSHPADGFLAALSTEEEPSLKAARELLAVNQASRSFLEGVLAEEQP